MYETIVRRFLAIFYPPAVYEKINLTVCLTGEYLFASEKYLKEPGYLDAMEYSFRKKRQQDNGGAQEETSQEEEQEIGTDTADILAKCKKAIRFVRSSGDPGGGDLPRSATIPVP